MATDWRQLTVVDLRQELKRRGLPQTGKKADLVERLAAAESEEATQDTETVQRTDDGPKEPLNRQPPTPESRDEPASESAPVSQPSETPAAQEPQTSQYEGVPSLKQEDALPSTKKLPSDEAGGAKEDIDDAALLESATLVPQDISRKRRSRSPIPDDELSRKRARPSDEDHAMDTEMNKNNFIIGEDVSYAVIQPDITEPRRQSDSRPAPRYAESDNQAKRDTSTHAEERKRQRSRSNSRDRYRQLSEDVIDEDRNVAPAEHRATSALYIKNFMRPLRESTLRGYLSELAAPRGRSPDPDAIEEFYLDQIRTHAFVRFRSISAASRVRIGLHGRVWPNERERKELWVDFIPADAVAEWADLEQTGGGRGTRWEVRYDVDSNGDTTARLVNAEAEPARPPTRPPPPPQALTAFVPTGPSHPPAGVEGAPLGPRGRGSNAYRQQSFPTAVGDWRETQARPPLLYKPVREELAKRRIDNMRKYYTNDRNRDLGREDEINRYTFQNEEAFVDRGKEVFIGIRPPHREHERRRALAGGDYRGPRGFQPSYAPRGDRYFGSARNDRDVPRSRLDGAPLPTFDNYRFGGRDGGRGGGGRRDGYRGGRR